MNNTSTGAANPQRYPAPELTDVPEDIRVRAFQAVDRMIKIG